MAQIDFFNDGQPIEDAFKRTAARLNQRLNEVIAKEMGAVLCECADKRDFDGFSFLIGRYPELINTRDSDNDTPLIVAANMGSEKITELALAQPGVEINAKGKDGMTAFMWTCEENYTDLGKLFLSRDDLDITIKDEDGDTALLLAVQSENSELVRLILERDGADVEDKDNEGGSAHSMAEKFKGDTFDQKEILALIKAHKSYKEPAPAATVSGAARETGSRRGAAASQGADGFKSRELARYAKDNPHPHSLAFLRWADSQGYQDIRHASKRIAHNGRPLMTPDLRNFVTDANALYADRARGSYDPKALSICTHIGYDPSGDYPLASAETGATPKPPGATP